MLIIKDTLVSLDLIEEYFHCDLSACRGECCVEGDAGAPVTREELDAIDAVLPLVKDDLTPAALRVIESDGTGYVDEEGDLVTSIVCGRDCVFTTYAPGGLCLCALEKAYREGRAPHTKPMSCHLYPARLKSLPGGMTAVNLHRWKICEPARKLGRSKGVRAYEFLRDPLIRRFGADWYAELELTARQWLSRPAGNE